LNLSKSQAELLGSRLQGWNLLQKNTNISIFRYQQKDIAQYFASAGDLVYCTDIDKVMAALGQDHKTDEWRLFVDSSKHSLKAVLLHNGNKHPSIPIAYAVHMKETYENMKNILDKINYNKHCWNVCSDLKIIAILLGVQLGYTKYCCFICEWDSRDKDKHYSAKHWKKHQKLTPGERNVVHDPLVDAAEVFLLPLHIKLGSVKNFVKAMKKDGPIFHICSRNSLLE
jgi:hypothetical protein